MTGTAFYMFLWCVLAASAVLWIILFLRLRIDHGIWKTKKDFSFNDLDKMLQSQDYKAEVSKYLHKYKSDRRWYENRLAWEISAISVLTLMLIAVLISIIVIHGRIS